jgi:hypothetical protein
MIPKQFSRDVIERCHKLLVELDGYSRRLQSATSGNDLSATFLLSMAMPLVVIPIEGRKDKLPEVTCKIESVSGSRFQDVPFLYPAAGIWWCENASISLRPFRLLMTLTAL